MAPKKDKGKAEEAPKTGGGFTEVERTFLELQITECNRKIARLRAAVDEYETRNEELQKAYDQLDEDRADIISYLKKSLNLKNEENSELKDKVKGLEETREIETNGFNQTVAELEKDFTMMKDQLSSENKLLAGKLNTLEEFRAIRDDLMIKFEKQEQDFEDQEAKYKKIIYDGEKKYIVSKDKLKKEMEGRLLQLAQDFQDATELRIAASTHRVIRENIALNNELDNILSTQAKLAEQNEKYRVNEKAARVAKELAEQEKDKAINKSVVQLKVIDQLTTAFQEIKKNKILQDKKVIDFDAQQAKIQKLTKENENLVLQVRILEQNLHNSMSLEKKASIEVNKINTQCDKLKDILKDAAVVVKAALKLDQWAVADPSKEIMDRQNLLSRLLEIVSQYRDIQHADSIDTPASFTKVYEEGDLGFIAKSAAKRSLQSSTQSYTSKGGTSRKTDRSTPSVSVDSSTYGSVRTIPRMQIVPPDSEAEVVESASFQSLITSSKSPETVEEEVEPEINKMLEASKVEVQKSIMKESTGARQQEDQKGSDVKDMEDDEKGKHKKESKVGFDLDVEQTEREEAGEDEKKADDSESGDEQIKEDDEAKEEKTADIIEESTEDKTADVIEESPEDKTTDVLEESPEDKGDDVTEESPEDKTDDDTDESAEDKAEGKEE